MCALAARNGWLRVCRRVGPDLRLKRPNCAGVLASFMDNKNKSALRLLRAPGIPPSVLRGRMAAPLCGRPCKSGKPCSWDAGVCPVHGKCETFDMEREDKASRRLQRGVCAAPTASGGSCQQIRGDCPYHAATALRCTSCLDADPTRRCSLQRERCSEYCTLHADFPNFGRVLQGYAEECPREGVPFSLTAFHNECYPHAANLPPGNLHALVRKLLSLPDPSHEPV